MGYHCFDNQFLLYLPKIFSIGVLYIGFFVLDPDSPVFLTTPITASEDTVTIQGSLSPVFVINTEGGITHYQLNEDQFSDLPPVFGERERVGVDKDMVIGPDIVQLEPETRYYARMHSVFLDPVYCPDGVEGPTTNIHLCTGSHESLLQKRESLLQKSLLLKSEIYLRKISQCFPHYTFV